MKQVVVPFLGAGFSYGASDGKGYVSWPNSAPDALKTCLDEHLAKVSCDGSAPACTTRNGVDEAKQKGLGQLAEWASMLLGPVELCKKLKIARFAEFHPLPSHRHLVHLVREGLIREIITTNYDTCLETAFRESHELPSLAEKHFAVVTSLEAYRQETARHLRPGDLVIHKINGCAEEYVRSQKESDQNKKEEGARRIILTERQLQNFRHERWAQELLQDRARTRTFMFSGFGSEEPQIRHSVLTLMEEFSSGGRRWLPQETMNLANAPFIQVYGHKLQFYQMQILVGFLDAHSQPILLQNHPEARIEPVFQNVFCGAGPDGKLEAGEFMRRLFRTTFRKVTIKALSPDQDFAFWLRSRTPHWRAWLGDLAVSLINEDALERLIAPPDNGAFPMPLWRLLYFMRHPESNREPSDYYLPLREEPILILMTLICLYKLGTPEGFSAPCDISVPLQEAKGIANTAQGAPIMIRLIEESAVTSVIEGKASCGNTRLLRLIAIPSRYSMLQDGRWQKVTEVGPGGIKRLRIGRWIVVSVSDLVERAKVPGRMTEVLSEAFAASRSVPAARLKLLPAEGVP